MKVRFLLSCAVLGIPALAQPALADAADRAAGPSDVTEIVVTADKTSRPIDKIPVAISVVSGDDIQKLGKSKIDEVLQNTPGVVVQGVARGNFVSIRGLGLNLPPQNGSGAVSTNYDGVYSNRAEASSAGFYDLDQVEVLRGPQSTIYGRNAVGGVVNVNSRDPQLGKFGGYLQGEVGSYGNIRGEGAINLPFGEDAALRVSAAGVSRDGYISNGRDDNKASALRAKLLFRPSGDISVLLGAETTLLGGKGPGAIPIASYDSGSRVTTDPPDGYQHAVHNKFWAVLKADIGPGQLYVEPSYQTTKGFVRGSFGGNFSTNWDPLYNDEIAIEARYGSKPGAPVQWNVGFYHYNLHDSMLPTAGSCFDGVNLYQPADGFSNIDLSPGPPGRCVAVAYAESFGQDVRWTNSNAVFGQVIVPLAPSFRVILGGRYTDETIGGSSDFNSGASSGPPTFSPVTTPNIVVFPSVTTHHFDYRGGVEVDVAEHSLLYATVASGHRQGGYGFATSAGVPYNPEDMRSYEIGLKNRLLDGRLTLNIDAYYYDYSSYQLALAGPCSLGFCINIITPPGRQFGAELEGGFRATKSDNLTFSVNYMDSLIKGTTGYAGMPFTNSPRWQFKAGYSHEFDLGSTGRVTARGDFRALSSQLVFPRQIPAFEPPGAIAESTQRPYATGDLFLGWTSANDAFSITGYVKNVNDKLIKASDFFGYLQVQPPRTYGVTASVRF